MRACVWCACVCACVVVVGGGGTWSCDVLGRAINKTDDMPERRSTVVYDLCELWEKINVCGQGAPIA